MDKTEIIDRLRAAEAELRSRGIARLSLFGSTARGEASSRSDIDLAATFDPAAHIGMNKFFEIEARLRTLLRAPIDLVGEPARNPRFQRQIDQDRIHVF